MELCSLMKRILVVFALALLTISANAQERTLFGGKVDHGGFGGPAVKFTNVKGEFGVLVGGYGGWLIDHTIMLGGGGFGLVNDIRATPAAEALYDAPYARPLYLEFGYGGGIIEVILRSDDVLHLYGNVLIGGGSATYRRGWNDRTFSDGSERHYGDYDGFFVVEPSVNAELNLTTWMRLGAGVSYRYISGIGILEGISNKDLSGASGQLTVKFGAF